MINIGDLEEKNETVDSLENKTGIHVLSIEYVVSLGLPGKSLR